MTTNEAPDIAVIAAINAFDRLGISTRPVAGHYTPGDFS
jgi:hypothetical protein